MSLKSVPLIKDDVYNRPCPVRDGDMCERQTKMAKKKVKALPKTIYVVRDIDTCDDPILLAYDDYVEIEDEKKVGIYELKETVTKIVQHGLE
jgi:ATP/maltotriose-dependent transcriptional regulator MalT